MHHVSFITVETRHATSLHVMASQCR